MPNLLRRIKTAWEVLAGYHLQEWTPDRRWWVNTSQEAKKDIPYGVRRSMLSWSRDLERRDPLFNRFLDLCEQYVIGPTGLRIVSDSANTAWGARANAEFAGWEPYCDISSLFGWGQRQSLIEREVEVAGEVFIHLTFGSTARPRIKLIESEHIETPPGLTEKDRVFDGVRLDANDRPVSYFIKPADPSKPWPEIPAEQMLHIFEPSRVGQVRGLPIVYAVLRDLIDLDELQGFEMRAAKDAARTSKVIKTATGEVSVSQLRRSRLDKSTQTPAGTAVTSSKSDFYHDVIGAETVVLQKGDEYQQFASDRPSVAVQSFWDYVSARAAAGLGLPVEILIMRSLQGTMTRAALDMANGFFRCRTAARGEAFRRVWEHVIGSTLPLRAGQPGDWRNIKFTPPRAINVDVGRNSTALINEWKAGFRTLESIAAETGQDWQDIIDQRGREASYAKEKEVQLGLIPGSLLGGTDTQPEPATTTTEPATT
jgi:capsid protein